MIHLAFRGQKLNPYQNIQFLCKAYVRHLEPMEGFTFVGHYYRGLCGHKRNLVDLLLRDDKEDFFHLSTVRRAAYLVEYCPDCLAAEDLPLELLTYT